MNRAELWKEVIADTRALLSRGGGKPVELSPEFAERLTQFVPTPAVVQEELFAAPEEVAPAGTAHDPARVAALAALRQDVAACTLCGLCQTRNKTVFGSGNPHTQILFVGEAPGADEDRQGEPFVGKAGALLTDIIEKGFKIPRPEVYICNVLKCRPPENRDPNPEEMMHCEPYLVRQIELIQPRVIVALGRIAAQALLKTNTPIGKLRGSWHTYQGIPLRATFHPAYLLRNPGDKRLAWDDVKEVLRFLEEHQAP